MFDEFVYVLKAGRYYKIGKTKDVTRRIGELAIQLPFKVELFKVFNTNDADGLEKDLHKRYGEYRVNGEWFKLPKERAAWLLLFDSCREFPEEFTDEAMARVGENEEMRMTIFKGVLENDYGGVVYWHQKARRAEWDRLQRLCCFGV